MNSTEDTIWDAITDSAKARFDYKSFDAAFQETASDTIAEDVLFKIIVGLSCGETKEAIARELKTDVLLIGYGFDDQGLQKLLANKEEELKTEIFVTQFANSMIQREISPTIVLHQVLKMLTGNDKSQRERKA